MTYAEVRIKLNGKEAEQGVDGLESSVKNFKQQLREANGLLNQAVDKFGLTSQEAKVAAKEVARLKDTMADAKALADGFNPDAKFKAFGSVVQGIAGGFSAMQGAMALAGNESEDLQKTMVKLQGAMALTQGLNAIGELKDQFKIVASVIKTEVIGAFTTLKGALIATGIGVLAVALGVIISNWEDFKSAIIDTFPTLGRLGEMWDNVKKAAFGFIGAAKEAFLGVGKIAKDFWSGDFGAMIDDASKLGERVGKGYKEGFQKEAKELFDDEVNAYIVQKADELERAIKVKKAKGGDTYAEEKKLAAMRISQMKEGSKEYLDALTEVSVKEAERQKKMRDDAAKKAEDEKRKREEAEKRKKEEENRRKDLIEKQAAAARKQNVDALNEEQRAQREKNLADAKAKSDAEKQLETGLASELVGIRRKVSSDTKDITETNKKISADEAAAKVALKQLEMDAFSAAIDLIGRNTVAGKALAVASTTISTFEAAQAAYRSQMTLTPDSPIRAALAAGVAVAQGLARVKGILSVQVPGRAGGGGSAPSIAAPPTAANTIVPRVQQQQAVTIDQNQVNQIGDRSAIRAYVVQTDVANSARRNQRIERAAVLGG
jgi:hypothetical protein